ncbi:hypothetical protein KI387_000283, partial [Taxus chinensis]
VEIHSVEVCEDVVKSIFTWGWTRLDIGKTPNVAIGLGLDADEGWDDGEADEEEANMTSLDATNLVSLNILGFIIE